MPVDTKHGDYNQHISQWTRCRTALAGEDAVKEAGETYLPKLDGQDDTEYSAYRTRASFFGAADRTVRGLVGAILRKPPDLKFPETNMSSLDHMTRNGRSLAELLKAVLEEVLGVGRYGLLVDHPEESPSQVGAPYVVGYRPEAIINWRVDYPEGKERLVMVVLDECSYEPDPNDPFQMMEKRRYRVLKIDAAGYYAQELWIEAPQSSKEQWILSKTIEPTIRGTRMKEIPFVFINANSTSADTTKPPVLDLVNVNFSHYRTSADLEHGRHFTALPTAWAAGFDSKQELVIGSGVAWVTDDPAASAGYLEFTGAGLGHLANALESKEKQMAVLGARLLEKQPADTEAAETVRLRQSGEVSILSSIARATSIAIQKVLQWYAAWLGALDTAQITFLLNTDFLAITLDGPKLTALMAMWQQGAISYDSLFYNLKLGEIVPVDRTVEEEQALVDANPPALLSAFSPQGGEGETQPTA